MSQPSSSPLGLVVLSALMLLGAGCQPLTAPVSPPTSAQPTTVVTQNTSSTQATTTKQASEPIVQRVGHYEVYDASKLERAKTGTVVLFFYAPWCPTCQTVNADIKAHLEEIPSGLSLLIADYDSATDLRKKYGVTYQHTFVQVDAQGVMKKKWSGGSTLQSILTRLN